MLFKNQTRNNKLIKTFDVEDQQGDGFIGDMFRGVRNLGRKAACPKETRPLFPGENHAPCANFSGPGTNVSARLLRGDKPSGPTDRVAMQHDISYKNIGDAYEAGKISKAQAGQMSRAADMTMVAGLKNVPKGKGSFFNKAEAKLTKQIIQSKMKLEDIKVLDKTKFVLPNEGKGYPADKLREQARKLQKNKS
jgi:hypothetical protein